jgi:hypothetical protein
MNPKSPNTPLTYPGKTGTMLIYDFTDDSEDSSGD